MNHFVIFTLVFRIPHLNAHKCERNFKCISQIKRLRRQMIVEIEIKSIFKIMLTRFDKKGKVICYYLM